MRQVPEHVSNFSSFRLIFPFFIIIILDSMSFGMVTPVLAPLVMHSTSSILGGNLTSLERHMIYGVIQTLSFICYMVGAPIIGYLSDYYGRRKVLIYCLIGSFMGLCAYAYSFLTNSLLILVFARIVVGFTSGNQAVAQSAIADVSSGVEKARNIGVIAVAMTIGLVVGPLIGGVLSDPTVYYKFNNATPFYFGILIAVFNLVILFTYLRETNVHNAAQRSWKNLWHNFFGLLTQVQLRGLLLTFFLFELSWTLYFQSLALLLAQSFNFQNKGIGFFSSYVGLILSIGLFYGVRFIVKKLSLNQLIIPSLAMGAISLIVGFLFNSLGMQFFIAIPIALCVAFCYTTLITLISDRTPAEQQGLIMGITDCLIALAFTVTSLLASWLTYYSSALPELIAALFAILAISLFKKIKYF